VVKVVGRPPENRKTRQVGAFSSFLLFLAIPYPFTQKPKNHASQVKEISPSPFPEYRAPKTLKLARAYLLYSLCFSPQSASTTQIRQTASWSMVLKAGTVLLRRIIVRSALHLPPHYDRAWSIQHPVQDLSKTDKSIGRGPDTQRESPKVRGIAGHIEQAERGAIRKSPQAHKHFTHFYPQQWFMYRTGLY
jgi:hypothetical protein